MKYKYWIIYKNNEMYAYTDDKSIFEKFQLQRNMELFNFKKVKLTKDEVNDLAKDYKYKILRERLLKTIDRSISYFIDVSMVITDLEYNITMSISNYTEIQLSTYCWINPFQFNDSIYNSLIKIGYISIYNTIVGKDEYIDENDDDVNLIVDEFQVFLKEYSETLANI